MPANIEIKARVGDPAGFRQRAAVLSDTPVQVIHQEDIFFHTPQGRLKLRILAPDTAQLVYYTRRDDAGPKRSDYQILKIRDVDGMRSLLECALGVRGAVRKTRRLFRVGQTRIHLDDVVGLGTFVELEVVLREGQSDTEGRMVAESLMGKLGIVAGDLIEGAYMDLIEGNVRT